MHPDLATVRELQAVDRTIGSLTSRIQVIPSQIKQIEDQLNAFLHALEEHKQRLAANQKERRDLDAETQMIRAKISKHRDQLYELKSNEQYKAMLHEIGGEEAKIRGIEDRILEKMTEAEELEKFVHDAAARLEGERSRVAAEKQELGNERAADEASRKEAQERRRTLAAALVGATLQLYEKARKARGTAVVEVVDGSCAGCHVKLRPQYFNEVRSSEALLTCESCGRILYYLESPVDHAVEGTRVVMEGRAEPSGGEG
ncbi:MAG TPA: C4-type zinc ribbon domain-containing protein [Terriglobia bacterium]|nr:C4-type zinc ribbon domain-containing protein [Terriglobia bacterium]